MTICSIPVQQFYAPMERCRRDPWEEAGHHPWTDESIRRLTTLATRIVGG